MEDRPKPAVTKPQVQQRQLLETTILRDQSNAPTELISSDVAPNIPHLIPVETESNVSEPRTAMSQNVVASHTPLPLQLPLMKCVQDLLRDNHKLMLSVSLRMCSHALKALLSVLVVHQHNCPDAPLASHQVKQTDMQTLTLGKNMMK